MCVTIPKFMPKRISDHRRRRRTGTGEESLNVRSPREGKRNLHLEWRIFCTKFVVPALTNAVRIGQPQVDVFVSYSSPDKSVADALVATLEKAQLRCWYAPRDIRPGKIYGDAILEGLRDSRTLVVIVSASSVASQQVLREVERAVHYGLTVVPFRIEDIKMTGSMEFFLSVPHWLDALTPPLESHLGRLVESVRGVLASTTHVTAAPAVPPATVVTLNAPPVREISPDQWSRRPGGRVRQFFNTLFEDHES
jgi:TIR domain